jgi:hypothetical protein
MVLVSAFLDSTCALVDRVIKGYLQSSQHTVLVSQALKGVTHVKAIESNPPPAPASACATLSLCCATMACPAGEFKGAFCACDCGWAAMGSGLEGVGAATLSDMFAVFDKAGLVGMDLDGMLIKGIVCIQVVYRAKERNWRPRMAALRVVVLFGDMLWLWPW